MHRLTSTVVAGALLALPPAIAAQQPRPIPYEMYTLENGLRVILSEDHSSQVVEIDLWYGVGSRNERPGRTGFAHLFEHMMFQGSAHVKKAEHFQLVERAGGTENGSTHDDYTNYFETLPSNRLNLGLWLEADRMRSLAVTDSTFHNQRQAVKEERRLRIENQPYASAIVEELPRVNDSANCFGYSHPGIGSMADLDAATTADVKAFFAQYYVPNNATLAIVGDFEPAEAKRLVASYFGDIPKGTTPQAVSCQKTYNSGERVKHLRDPKATLPASVRVYRAPEYESPDTPALELLAAILGQGESSRLNVKLAREAKAAITVQALHNPFGARQGPGAFITLAIANQGVKIDSLDALVRGQVADIVRDGVTAMELAKAKNSYRAGVIEERQRVHNLAEALQLANRFLGSPAAVNTDFERYSRVSVDDIKRVAQTYLRPDNSLVLLVSSEGGQ